MRSVLFVLLFAACSSSNSDASDAAAGDLAVLDANEDANANATSHAHADGSLDANPDASADADASAHDDASLDASLDAATEADAAPDALDFDCVVAGCGEFEACNASTHLCEPSDDWFVTRVDGPGSCQTFVADMDSDGEIHKVIHWITAFTHETIARDGSVATESIPLMPPDGYAGASTADYSNPLAARVDDDGFVHAVFGAWNRDALLGEDLATSAVYATNASGAWLAQNAIVIDHVDGESTPEIFAADISPNGRVCFVYDSQSTSTRVRCREDGSWTDDAMTPSIASVRVQMRLARGGTLEFLTGNFADYPDVDSLLYARREAGTWNVSYPAIEETGWAFPPIRVGAASDAPFTYMTEGEEAHYALALEADEWVATRLPTIGHRTNRFDLDFPSSDVRQFAYFDRDARSAYWSNDGSLESIFEAGERDRMCHLRAFQTDAESVVFMQFASVPTSYDIVARKARR